jgi:hypothetical protein
MKVLRYILPLVLLVARLSATITPTADVYGPQQPASLTATFTSGLAFQQSSDLIIIDAGQTNAPRYPATVLVLGSDYTVSGGGYNSANQMQLGTFTLTNTGGASIILGDNIYVLRNVSANQLTVFANGGYLTAAMIEQALDKQATLSQMAFNTGNASLRVEAYETTNSVPPQLVMTKKARAGKLLGFDANGNVSFTTSSGGSAATGIQSVSGTTNQVIAVTTNNAVTLSTPQNIDTSAAVQFGSLGIGIAPSVSIPINLQPSVTDNAGTGKAVRISPTIFQSQTGDAIYNTILGGTINSNSYTNGNIYELTLGSPTVSGSYNVGYQLYLAGLNSGTFTSKYGIFQNGTETNQLNNLKLTPSGGGAITFADGTVQSTAASGSGGGVTSIIAGTGITTNASTGSVTITNSGVTNLVQGTGITLNAAFGSVTISASGTAGVTTANGTANQVLVNGTSGTAQTGAIILTTPQSIGTTSSPQFFSIGLGSGAGPIAGAVSILGNYYGQSLFSTSPFGIADTPTLVAAANSQSFTGLNVTPILNPASYTNLSYYGINLGTPSGGSSSVSTAYQLYIAAAPTATTKYGIYQAGTDTNQVNNLKLTPSGGGGITFADGTTQTTAASGSGGGVTNIAGTINQITTNASTGSVVLSTPQNIDTAANVQFSTLGIGTAIGAGNGVNLQPTITASAGQAKGLRISPTITGAANGDSLYDTIIGGTISTSFTTSNLYELILGAPTVTGSYSNGYQLYLSGLSSGTYSNKYGIYQAGTEANVFGGSVSVPAFTTSGTVTLGSLTGYLYGTSGVVSAVSTIPNSGLTNSSITIAGTSTALGGSITQDTITNLSTTGLVKRTGANTLAIATSGTDYAPATSGTSILYGNGSGGFSNVTIGSGVSFSGGTLSATGSGGTVTSFSAGALSPLFTTSVATSTLTPALSFSLTNAAAGTIFGNNSGTSGAPAYNSISSYLDTFSSTQGAILYRNSTGWAALAPGTAGQVLATSGSAANPSWTNASVGTVTSVSGTGTVNGISLSGTVTSSGSLTLGGTLSGVSLTTQVSGILPVTNGGTGVTTSTGTGSVVLSNSPTLVTHLLY